MLSTKLLFRGLLALCFMSQGYSMDAPNKRKAEEEIAPPPKRQRIEIQDADQNAEVLMEISEESSALTPKNGIVVKDSNDKSYQFLFDDIIGYIFQFCMNDGNIETIKKMRGINKTFEERVLKLITALDFSPVDETPNDDLLQFPCFYSVHNNEALQSYSNFFTQLKFLSLRDMEIDEDSLQTLRGMTNLTSLNLFYPRSLFEPENKNIMGLSSLQGLPLTKLSIDARSVPNLELMNLQNFPLTSLDLISYEITDLGLSSFKELPLTSLRLRGCHDITDEGLKNLQNMPLTSLDFSQTTYISTEGIFHLRGLTQLTSLGIRGCNYIGKKQAISIFKTFPQLKLLNLSNIYITGVGKSELPNGIEAEYMENSDRVLITGSYRYLMKKHDFSK